MSLRQHTQFIEMFKEAPIVKLGNHIDTQSGGTPNTKKAEYYEGGDIPWLSSGEVNQGYINGTEKFITKAGLDNSSAKWSRNAKVLHSLIFLRVSLEKWRFLCLKSRYKRSSF